MHPGSWLRSDIIEAHGLSVTDAASHLGVTRQALANLLTGKYPYAEYRLHWGCEAG